ncbi:hypothetical protein MPER_00841 [Moniliophthora perniciosa FA553]|nr:hypothetical protein MPER_00841 [Moniliophthora perniciosa FA553]
MREEMEEGKFTEDGNYIRSCDPHAVHDRWMDGLDEKEIRQARKRKKQQERIEMEKAKAEEKEIEESGGKPAMVKQLLAMLKKGETVLEAFTTSWGRDQTVKRSLQAAPWGCEHGQ